ncbi:MAG: polyprenyl diphosphate synthase [Clostridia bacterium]
MDKEIKIPKHIAFIMDGNGRWAKAHLLPRKMGHKQGVVALKKIVEECNALGVGMVSFYAFSTENWSRPQAEIDELFALVTKFADEELDKYSKLGYRVMVMGDMSQLPQQTQDSLNKIVGESSQNKGMIVNIAINYGGRQEILRAVNTALQSGLAKITMEDLSNCMYTAGLADPDLIVRSSGEKRLSNFMLWQCAYSEFVFVDEHWPDFDKKILEKILVEYSKRDRRFGKIARVE